MAFQQLLTLLTAIVEKSCARLLALNVGLPLETDTGFLLTESKTSGIDTIERTDFLFKISLLSRPRVAVIPELCRQGYTHTVSDFVARFVGFINLLLI